MQTRIAIQDLPKNGSSYLFLGSEHGNAPVSFFLSYTLPGHGPGLHMHPYAETFIVQKGQVTFYLEDQAIEVEGGTILVVPPNTPHRFINSGDEPLQQISIHPVSEMITHWLEEPNQPTNA
uniref:Cupin type-2 domain-containing protein n=1 Tax=Thermosporothrix sp. COM3 TaxID=2490863 RepID=A0A455SH68_9CHLR|nr:hypothetical protein KTC_16410 [Thermosporothrix sp. COM3]